MLKRIKLSQLFFSITILFFSAVSSVNYAQASEQEAWTALQQGKAVAILRHAYAPHTNEKSPISPVKCANERNISAEGADQAKEIAQTFRANKINKANVYSSHRCRCVDTGVLFNFGEVKNLPALNGYGSDRSRGPAQTKELRAWIKNSIEQAKDTNILVTHGFNVSDIIGVSADQGEVVIIGVKDDKLVNLHQFTTPYF